MSGWETKMVCEREGGIKKESGRWIMMNDSAEDSRTSVATVWVSIHNSLSLQSSSPSLYQTLLLTAVLHCGLLNLIIGLLPASFTPLLFLLKTLMTLILQCSCIVQTHPGPPTHIPVCSRSFVCVCVSISTPELFTNRLWICWLAGKQLTTFATCPSSRS